MSERVEYFVIYAISKDVFRIVSSKETNSIQFYKTYDEAAQVKAKLQHKNPNVNYHIRTFQVENKFIDEMN